jgi:hypothetical protein
MNHLTDRIAAAHGLARSVIAGRVCRRKINGDPIRAPSRDGSTKRNGKNCNMDKRPCSDDHQRLAGAMKIGDIVPLPADYDPQLVRAVMYRRRMTARLDQMESRNQAIASAKKAVRDAQTVEERLRDPLEQAKAFLRRKGYKPVATIGAVHHVGHHKFETDTALFAFADQKGWGR